MPRWLIPVFFLVLAIIACDAPYYDPPHVLSVAADPATSGRVYAAVGTTKTQSTYRSDDYGLTWQPSTQTMTPEKNSDYSMRGDSLTLGNTTVWSFPRPIYRYFFLNDPDNQYFALPDGKNVSVSGAGGVTYVAMGTEGVLSLNAPNEWRLSAQGIDVLHPLPLTITDAPTILMIIALALLIPPLPLLHAYLLSRVWLYALPPDQAWRLALRVSAVLSALAALAITIWLTDARTDYFGIVAVMSVITVLAGIGATMSALPADQVRHFAWRVALVSLIVPAGVATIWGGWLIILPLVTCYLLFRALYTRMLKGWETVSTGLLDHLTIQSFGVLLACTGTVFILGGLLSSVLRFSNEFILLAPLLSGVWSVVAISRHLAKRLPDEPIQSIRVSVSVATFLCYALGGGAAALVFIGQMAVYDGFTQLLIVAR